MENHFWQPFGEIRWRDFAETAGATELQLKFAVARFSGASAAAAAKIAGYAGDHDSMRRAGYENAWCCPLLRQMLPYLKHNLPAIWSIARRHLAQ